MIRKAWAMVGIASFWLSWPLLWIYLRQSHRTRVLLTIPNGEILLVKRWLGSGEWILPGGGIRKNETAISGAIRETYEETGIKLQPKQLTLLSQGIVREHGLSFKYNLLIVEMSQKPVFRPQTNEVTAINWATPDVLEGLSPATVSLLASWHR